MKERCLVSALWLGVVVGLSGCGTVQDTYHPQTMGALTNRPAVDGLLVQLKANENNVQIGKPAVFSVVARNISDKAIWMPKKPLMAFTWTYPNGQRDCQMVDRAETQFFKKSECILLEPGHELILGGMVETSYFELPGITEFRAEIQVPKNTNPELQPFWSGRAFSNGYGAQIVPFKPGNKP